MAWQHYTQLIVWQKAMDLVDEVYELTKLLPRDERYALCDQMRRAVVSVPSNIAEGHGRQSAQEYRYFLSIARGSNAEIETQLFVCARQNYLTQAQIQPALTLCEEVRKMLTAMILQIKK